MRRQKQVWLKLLGLTVAVLVLAGCGAPTATTQGTSQSDSPAVESHSHGEEFELPHVHGLGFTSDGKQLVIPAHIGLFTVRDNTWQRSSGPEHDYMGFSISDDGFYSSGHPAPSATDLTNPLGLVKSTDGGQTLQKLGFEGESDFHVMSVGYTNHAIYVLNPMQNSKLVPGMHYSLDDGATWKQSAVQGVSAVPLAIAVHPTQAEIVALATEQGVLLSSDYGATFTRVGAATPVSAVTFSADGRLLFGATELTSYDVTTKQRTPLALPALVENEVLTAIAVNPQQATHIALATSELNIFQTHDGGQQWQQLAGNGTGINVTDEH